MPAKIELSDDVVEEMCELFKSGIAIPELMTRYKLSRNKITRVLKEALRDEYAKVAKFILSLSGMKVAPKLRGRKNPHTPEWNAKIGAALKGKSLSDSTKAKLSESGRTRFARGTWTREAYVAAMQKAIETKKANGYFDVHGKRHSEWMLANAPMRGKTMSEETRQKMRDSKQRFFKNGGVPSQVGIKRTFEQKELASTNTKKMWADEKFTYGDGSVMRSKLEKSLFERIKVAHPDAEHSHVLKTDDVTYIFDIYIPSKRMLIEVNGNYWHFNPKIYVAEHFDKHRNVIAQQIWERDAFKLNVAKERGFEIVVIWEDEADVFSI